MKILHELNNNNSTKKDEYVCNLFGIHNFLMTLKYNLNIYENGINIKVGQKKIEFSRAFIKQSKYFNIWWSNFILINFISIYI